MNKLNEHEFFDAVASICKIKDIYEDRQSVFNEKLKELKFCPNMPKIGYYGRDGVFPLPKEAEKVFQDAFSFEIMKNLLDSIRYVTISYFLDEKNEFTSKWNELLNSSVPVNKFLNCLTRDIKEDIGGNYEISLERDDILCIAKNEAIKKTKKFLRENDYDYFYFC